MRSKAVCCDTRISRNSKAEQTEPIKTTYKGLDIYQCGSELTGNRSAPCPEYPRGFRSQKAGPQFGRHTCTLSPRRLKLAFADRDRYIADPRFATSIPVGELLSKEYAAKRRALIRMERAYAGCRTAWRPAER